MPAVYEIKFLPSGEVREFYGSRGDYYELEDGSHINVLSGPVWCHRCNDFTDGEYVGSLEEIDQHLEELRDPLSKWSRGLRFRQSHIESLEQRRRWLMGRVSPPKCLECGSAEVVVFPRGERVKNPTGTGWVEVTVTGHCSTSFNNRFYTPEGDRIPRDTKPTYWSWPWESGGRPS
jgi:hypothetical protein